MKNTTEKKRRLENGGCSKTFANLHTYIYRLGIETLALYFRKEIDKNHVERIKDIQTIYTYQSNNKTIVFR